MRVFAKALDDLMAIEGINFMPMSCQQPRKWPGGSKVLGYMKDIEYEGLTGLVKFDLNGFRTDFGLELLEKQKGNMIKTGTWSLETGVNFTRTSQEVEAQNEGERGNENESGNFSIFLLALSSLHVLYTLVLAFIIDSDLYNAAKPLSPIILLSSLCTFLTVHKIFD